MEGSSRTGVRVLIVDDSSFFRSRIRGIIASDSRLQLVGEASNGHEAIAKARQLHPDVITMDLEMPELNGIEATREIMRVAPIPILMFSSFTTSGAKATLDALDAGAVDYLPKKLEDIAHHGEEIRATLCDRLYSIARKGVPNRPHLSPLPPLFPPPLQRLRTAPGVGSSSLREHPIAPPTVLKSTVRAAPPPTQPPPPPKRLAQIRLVAIGASTGGPVALQQLLTALPADFRLPILLIQHMPATFTPAYAQRLNQLCAITVQEAKDGDLLRPGVALLAPGGMQMSIEGRKGGGTTAAIVRITESRSGDTYKPSIDYTLSSIAKVEPAATLVIILTGMGADGCRGSAELKQHGSVIWSQDEASSTVYGMPAAVADAGISSLILPLAEIGPYLAKV